MNSNLKNVCFIPAKSNSIRLPEKNKINFFGKPLITYTIKSAIEAKCFKKIIVSTDDKEIIKIARSFGVEVDIRKKKLSKNKIKVSDVLIDFIKRRKKTLDFNVITCLFATAPLRNSNDILSVVKNINLKKCHFSVAVTKYNLPPHQALKISANKIAKPMWKKIINKRDEEIGNLVVDNGSTYSAFVPSFLKTKHFFGSPLKVHIMDYSRSIDINTNEDLELSKYFYKKNKGK